MGVCVCVAGGVHSLRGICASLIYHMGWDGCVFCKYTELTDMF